MKHIHPKFANDFLEGCSAVGNKAEIKRNGTLCFHTHAALSVKFRSKRPTRGSAGGSSDEPLLLALLDGFGEGWVADDDRCIRAIRRVCALGLVGVVGAFVAEHVPHHKHHDAEDSEDHHGDDA